MLQLTMNSGKWNMNNNKRDAKDERLAMNIR